MSNPNSGYGIGGYGVGEYGSPPITNLPTGYYLSILTSQYRSSSNFNKWLLAVLRKLDDISFLLASYLKNFDLDSATGKQLDTLGVIIGQSRTVGFQPTSGGNPTLDDTTYRILLKARIFQNQWDGLLSSLQAWWQSLFPGGNIAIQDNMNMTANVFLYGSFTQIIIDLINNGYLVPRPQAVLYNYESILFPLFGFDLETSFISGWDVGYWT